MILRGIEIPGRKNRGIEIPLPGVCVVKNFRNSNQSVRRVHNGSRRFEHWFLDNQVYFITARCHKKYPALVSTHAKSIFWERFTFYTDQYAFTPWIASLMDNHYHTLGYLERGSGLSPMMKGIHGSVAKLVKDVLKGSTGNLESMEGMTGGLKSGKKRTGGLKFGKKRTGGLKSPCQEDGRLVPFWGDGRKTYFDGCIRDETQLRRTYEYVMFQSERHGICNDWRKYSHTRIFVGLESAVKFSREQCALLEGVRYKRYEQNQ